MNICEKYYWVSNHPKYVPFGDSAIIEITPHMVCPETNRIENIQSVNTKLEFWVELMIPHFDEQFKQHCHSHVWDLDCGGDTWEEAVEAIYQNVLQKYGDYTEADLDAHREEAMKGFDFDKWMNSAIAVGDSDYEYADPIMYSDEELKELEDEIVTMVVYEKVLKNKIQDPSISFKEHGEIEIELQCVDHDLKIARASLSAGYDVDRYGFPKDENV